MSFPYTTTSPPPTSGALTVVDKANLSQSYAGSGGGPIGPNPQVSTLTFSAGTPYSGNTDGTINMTSFLNILDPAVPTPDNFNFQYATNLNPQAGGYPSYVQQYQSSFNGFSVFGPSSDVAKTGVFAFSTDILGRSQIVAANANGNLSTLVLSAESVLVPTGMNISSLTVSSINGAQPGSAVIPAQIAVSSINVNSTGYIEMFQDNTNNSGRIIGYGDVNNASSLSLAVGFVAGYASKINGTDGLWCVENDATGANQAYGDFGAGRFAVLGNNAGASKSVPVLDSDGAGNLDINADGAVNISTTSFTVNGAPVGGGGVMSSIQLSTSYVVCANDGSADIIMTSGAGDITANAAGNVVFSSGGYTQIGQTTNTFLKQDAFTNTFTGFIVATTPGGNLNQSGISTTALFCSSINGSAPGGGYAPFFSTLNQSPTTIDCDPGTTTLLSFSTIANHLYQIQTQMTIQGNGGQEGTANDDVIQEVLNEITLNTTQGSFISTANAAARDVGIGTCGMWKSNLTGTSLAINGTFSTTVQLNEVYLTDFGPV